jgi:uncharacterized protein with PIN domain
MSPIEMARDLIDAARELAERGYDRSTLERYERAERCAPALAREVVRLTEALEHAVYRNHTHSTGCDGCRNIDAALSAAKEASDA